MGKYARLTNGEVWYEATGDGAPVLLIHGGAVDGRFFAQNVGPLAETFRVITMDLWGHGRTADRDGPFSLDSFATDAAELIEQIAGGRAHVLGHSIGAAVALVLAQDAVAQDEPTALGEITVTARKRAESLQDVPFAISARTGENLEAVGAQNIEDVARNIAGLSVQNLGPGQSQVGLRGISAGKIDRDLSSERLRQELVDLVVYEEPHPNGSLVGRFRPFRS